MEKAQKAVRRATPPRGHAIPSTTRQEEFVTLYAYSLSSDRCAGLPKDGTFWLILS